MTKRRRRRFTKRLSDWNENRRPMGWWEFLFWLVLASVWVAATIALWQIKSFSLNGVMRAFLVGYIWVGLGGIVATMFVLEVNRALFPHSAFLPYKYPHGHESRDKVPPQPRRGPRIEPIVIGVIERLLFTTLAVGLFYNAGDHIFSRLTVLAAISAGYVGIKSIKRVQLTERATYATLHSIWGEGVSVGYAV